MEKADPGYKGPAFTSHTTDWKKGPQGRPPRSEPEDPNSSTMGSFAEEFPESNLVPGDESQTLTQTGKTKAPAKKTPKPVQTPDLPPETAEEGHLVLRLKSPPSFPPADFTSYEAGQEAFGQWQDNFHRLLAGLSQEVAMLSLNTVHHLHQREVATQKAAAAESVQEERENARTERCAAKTERKKQKLAVKNAEEKLDHERRRFRDCFAHEMHEWDGTRAQIELWLQELTLAEAASDSEEEEEPAKPGSEDESDSG